MPLPLEEQVTQIISHLNSLGFATPETKGINSFDELGLSLQHHIASVKAEIQSISNGHGEANHEKSDRPSVQTLVNTLTNLKQQSSNLLERKDELQHKLVLNSRYQFQSRTEEHSGSRQKLEGLHVDVGSRKNLIADNSQSTSVNRDEFSNAGFSGSFETSFNGN